MTELIVRHRGGVYIVRSEAAIGWLVAFLTQRRAA